MPFGEIDDETSPIKRNYLRFSGQWHDRSSTGLHYNWHRYYNPNIGKYLTPDPLGVFSDINLYSYANNNPINYTDPLGLDVLETLNKIIQATEEVSMYSNPMTYYNSIATSYVSSFIPDWVKAGRYAGTGFGEEAVDYWACKYEKAQSKWDSFKYGSAGLLASLWTEDTWVGTVGALSSAYSAQAIGVSSKGPWMGAFKKHPPHGGHPYKHIQFMLRVGKNKTIHPLRIPLEKPINHQ